MHLRLGSDRGGNADGGVCTEQRDAVPASLAAGRGDRSGSHRRVAEPDVLRWFNCISPGMEARMERAIAKHYFASSALCRAATSFGSSGLVGLANRAITFPFRSTKNLLKFQMISPLNSPAVGASVRNL